ncbi:signal transducer and activator of transcription 6 isoform X2 [Pogona vitticeps]|nr:signal transducer and activator of transcription 6 isoform X1 [Pogona vitticeps]
MTNSKMSLWSFVSKIPPEEFVGLFEEFPYKLRCLLGDWLENYPWEFINDSSDSFCVVLAAKLLSAMVEKLQDLAKKICPPGSILQLIGSIESRYRREPLQLVEAVRRILQAEQAAIQQRFQHLHLFINRQQEELLFEFSLQRLQYHVQELRESLMHMNSNPNVSPQLNSLDVQYPMQENLQANPLHSLQTLFLNVVGELEKATKMVQRRLVIWKRQQQLAGNGAPFDEDLGPLQKRFENLVNIYFQLRLELMAFATEFQPCLQERLDNVFSALIKNSFLVDKQPPQVLKTQTKFQATVRFLLGPHLLKPPHTSFMVTADIVTEKQARELATNHSGTVFSENTGEIVNNTAPLETNATSNACCAVFKNMLLKKIKRCDRKSTESVTEEKCAVLFRASVSLGPNKASFLMQALSLPIVVIVHGNQDSNAKATILWDNGFATTNRIPFMVAERVSWGDMCETLNQKFMAEVQTTEGLQKEHYFFLAQKIFSDSSASPEEFQNRQVSWSQFNKENLPGRAFTFWQWFEGVTEFTKKYLKEYWSDRLILGFVSKDYVNSHLCQAPVGTFLLRFSDSEIGGISIAYVTFCHGSTQVENIQPLTAKQLSVQSLADCIRDLSELSILFPNRLKDEAFRNHYNEAPKKSSYVRAKLTITLDTPSSFPALPVQAPVDPLGNSNGSYGICSEPVFGSRTGVQLSTPLSQAPVNSMGSPNMNPELHSDSPYGPPPVIPPPMYPSPSSNTSYRNQQLHPEAIMSYPYHMGNASPLGDICPYPLPQDVEMSEIYMSNGNVMNLPLSLPSNLIRVPETLPEPSTEEWEELLRNEQDPNRYCKDSE